MYLFSDVYNTEFQDKDLCIILFISFTGCWGVVFDVAKEFLGLVFVMFLVALVGLFFAVVVPKKAK